MKLSNILQQHILMFFKYTFVISYQSNMYNMDQYQPVEYVDFDLLSGDKSDLSRNRYDLVDDFGSRSSGLPLLSRGVRDIEESDEGREVTKESMFYVTSAGVVIFTQLFVVTGVVVITGLW